MFGSVGGGRKDLAMTALCDVDRTLRRVDFRPVRRQPTSEMRDAHFHVGVVSWANPWETTSSGRLVRWIVARHDVVGGQTRLLEDVQRIDRPEARIARHVVRVVGDTRSSTWVGVSANRLALYRQLEADQLPVTCGGEHNIALSAAVVQMNRRVAEEMRTPVARRFSPPPQERP